MALQPFASYAWEYRRRQQQSGRRTQRQCSSGSFKVRKSTVAPDTAWLLVNEDRPKGFKPSGFMKGLTMFGESTGRPKVWISYNPKFKVVGLTQPHRLLVPELIGKARPDDFGLDPEVPCAFQSFRTPFGDRPALSINPRLDYWLKVI